MIDFYKLGCDEALAKLGYVSPATLQKARQQYTQWYEQHGKAEGRTWDPQTIQGNAQAQQLLSDLDSAYDRYRKHTGRNVRYSRQIDFRQGKLGHDVALAKLGFKPPSFAPPGPTDFMSLHKLQAPGLSAEHPLKKQMSMLQGGKGQHAFKFGGTLANVIREDDDDNQTHQRQAQSLENMSMTGPGVSGVWDRFDDRIQNPAVASEHVRFVGE